MSGQVLNARVTFRKTPIHVLEKYTFRDIGDAILRVKKESGLDECVILQTCNRVEIFGTGGSTQQVKKTWAGMVGLEESAFEQNMETSFGTETYLHLLKLTSGLDSMVIGEEQILGQIRDSVGTARDLRASGRRLNTLFEKAIRIGTGIRNTTQINRGGISVGSMAVKLAEENVDDLKSKRTLLIGTGDVSALIAKSLNRRGYQFDVASRTLGRSKSFCDTMGGSAVEFEDILEQFHMYHLIFVATTAPYSLVTRERIQDAMRRRTDGVMILDLSNPRTVDEHVANITGVRLMNLDQIAEMVDKNMQRRKNKIRQVESIIGEELPVLEATMKRLDVEPMVRSVFQNVNKIRDKELAKTLDMLCETDERKIRIIRDLAREIAENIMSAPMNNLRHASEDGDEGTLDAAGKIFDYGKDGA